MNTIAVTSILVVATSFFGYAKTASAQVFAPTVVSCTLGSNTPFNPTGPETSGGGNTTLSSSAPNNVEQRCSWSSFAPRGTTAPRDLNLSFYWDADGVGANPIAKITAHVANQAITVEDYPNTGNDAGNTGGGGGSTCNIRVPAGTDISTLTVSAVVKSANTINCGPDNTCFGAEATIDIGYISAQ